MNRLVFFAALGAAALACAVLACGPRAPGPHANELIYWHVTSSDVQFANCSDDPQFRGQIDPIDIDAGNTYLIYLVSKDGKTATSQDCTSFDRASCTPGEIVFDVAGN